MRRAIRGAAMWALAALLGVTVAGCASLYKSRGEQLKVTVRMFNENVRWKNFRTAGEMVEEERREGWVRAMEHAGSEFTITDYEISPVEVGDEHAVVQVDLGYHHIHGVVVRPMRRRQTWRWDNNEWQLEADREVEIAQEPPPAVIPDFGEEEDEVAPG